MAVVTKYGTGARDPASLTGHDSVFGGAIMRGMFSSVLINNGDSIGSVVFFGKVPTDAVIDFNSTLDCTAATAAAMSLGFTGAPTALFNGQSIATAGSFPLSGGVVTAANRNKRVWELAGLSSNPGGFLDVIGTLSAAATSNGTVQLNLKYGKSG